MRLTRRRFLAASAAAGVAACASDGGATSSSADQPRVVRYGPGPSQVADLHLPTGAAPHPVVVLVHGGFWKAEYDRSLMAPLAHDLVARGVAVWNIEYRRVGEPGGGWPGTFEDVAAAVDALAGEAAVDTGRVVTCGHSAGGHLALWLAARSRLPAGAPGASPAFVPRAAVSLAGVADLVAASAAGLGGGAVDALLGGPPSTQAARYAAADPAELLPLGVAQLLVHGEADDVVPVAQSLTYAARGAAAGDDVAAVTFPGADHFAVIDPAHASWLAVVDRLPALLAGRTSS